MECILQKLYYTEAEETAELLPDSTSREAAEAFQALELLLDTFTKEQKALYLTYEEKRNNEQSLFQERLYKCAFKSGFRLAKELE